MSKVSIGLIGNPNCGKSTLFNALTGARQKVGNWPGVTIERKIGYLQNSHSEIELIDLPGIYSLAVPEEGAVDEQIACNAILSGELDLIINIVDVAHLERHLYLTTQLLEMGVPMIVVLNMADMLQQQGREIDLARLQASLKCPLFLVSANHKTGLAPLKEYLLEIKRNLLQLKAVPFVHFNPAIQSTLDHVVEKIRQTQADRMHQAYAWAIRLLEDDWFAKKTLRTEIVVYAKSLQHALTEQLGEEADVMIAATRYQLIHEITQQVVHQIAQTKPTWTQKIDRIVLNRFLGIPVFLVIMYFMFFFAINIGGAFQDFFDIGANALFVDGLTQFLQWAHLPNWFIATFAVGLGTGVSTTLTFIPVIGALFLFLSFLEDSGYMARAAFVVDRVMRAMGLPGKAFVPMIIGFGCNVPAIMAARTLENRRDRILTVMMSPFMSCGARLAIFAVFIAAFFPTGGQNIVFMLYVIGILMAILTGFILRKTVLKGETASLIMELPSYHLPRFSTLVLHAWQRLRSFLLRAGKVILPLCMVIGALNAINVDGTLHNEEAGQTSVLAAVGRTVTPIFAPMGIEEHNWPATVGLMTGVLAKEVVVGTLNTLYTQIGHLSTIENAAPASIGQTIKEAFTSIPTNLMNLTESIGNPILSNAPAQEVNAGVMGVMYHYFDGRVGAIAYLLFVLLYFPCVSATAAMLRESNRAWTLFSVAWTTGLAYSVAVIFYQLATFARHPMQSIIWSGALLIGFLVIVFSMRRWANQTSDKGIHYVAS